MGADQSSSGKIRIFSHIDCCEGSLSVCLFHNVSNGSQPLEVMYIEAR